MRIPQAIAVLKQAIRSEDQQLAGLVITALATVEEAPAELMDGLLGVLGIASEEQARQVGTILSRYHEAGAEKLSQAALTSENDPAGKSVV